MTGTLRRGLSRLMGWASDRRVPRFLRGPIYRGYARWTGADLSEVRLALSEFPSLGAFFVRELAPGARPIDADARAIVSPVDGTVQAVGRVERGQLLQAKGRSYTACDLCGGLDKGLDLEGGTAWTIYLSPRDYHRIHAPADVVLSAAQWIDGERFSVAPKVLDRRRVLEVNERAVLRLESTDTDTEPGSTADDSTFLLVLVGALNVGRIRVVGVHPTYAPEVARPGRRYARGAELARFEMGSTIVLIAPRGVAEAESALVPGSKVRLGQRIGRMTPNPSITAP